MPSQSMIGVKNTREDTYLQLTERFVSDVVNLKQSIRLRKELAVR